MKIFWVLLLPAALTADSIPRIGSIDYYGIRKVPESHIQKALGVAVGDPLPSSKGDVEDRLAEVPGVVLARLEAVCCDGNRGMLFVGIEEKGAAHFELRTPPAGDVTLPKELSDPYQDLVAAIERAAHRGSTAEDLTHGHPLAADPDARAMQEGFVQLVPQHLLQIRDVLRNSADPDQRAMAASLIGYAREKSAVVGDLEYAMQDPDENVRGDAMSALSAIAVLAKKQPELTIHISPTWFVEMLNSVVLSDRIKAAKALVNLTDARPAGTLDLLRERALPALAEMAQWHSLPYALPAFLLLGRVGGFSDKQIQDRWTRGDREAFVREVIAHGKKKRG
ncbi:MAG TPA: HEAT repeat domain-containing protein [Bryobacteraceae bacterium]|nr:HEAT repeat domain-containing protein [Bryobacteraceae bacterium]